MNDSKSEISILDSEREKEERVLCCYLLPWCCVWMSGGIAFPVLAASSAAAYEKGTISIMGGMVLVWNQVQIKMFSGI